MKEYNKIETVYARDTNGTKKLIDGLFRNEAVEYLARNIWMWTEKIDGTNIRIHWDGHKITFGGRTDKSQIPSHLLTKLSEMFLNNETEELFEQKFGEKEVTLFGEGYGARIQKGGDYRPDVSFILFDVLIDDIYLSRGSTEDIARCFGLEIVPIVKYGTIADAIEFVKSKPHSTIGTAMMEGLVGRPIIDMYDRVGNRVIVKIKACDFATEGGGE